MMRDDHLKIHMSSKHLDTLNSTRPVEIYGLKSTQSCTESVESEKNNFNMTIAKKHNRDLKTTVAVDSANYDDYANLKFQLL